MWTAPATKKQFKRFHMCFHSRNSYIVKRDCNHSACIHTMGCLSTICSLKIECWFEPARGNSHLEKKTSAHQFRPFHSLLHTDWTHLLFFWCRASMGAENPETFHFKWTHSVHITKSIFGTKEANIYSAEKKLLLLLQVAVKQEITCKKSLNTT